MAKGKQKLFGFLKKKKKSRKAGAEKTAVEEDVVLTTRSNDPGGATNVDLYVPPSSMLGITVESVEAPVADMMPQTADLDEEWTAFGGDDFNTSEPTNVADPSMNDIIADLENKQTKKVNLDESLPFDEKPKVEEKEPAEVPTAEETSEEKVDTQEEAAEVPTAEETSEKVDTEEQLEEKPAVAESEEYTQEGKKQGFDREAAMEAAKQAAGVAAVQATEAAIVAAGVAKVAAGVAYTYLTACAGDIADGVADDITPAEEAETYDPVDDSITIDDDATSVSALDISRDAPEAPAKAEMKDIQEEADVSEAPAKDVMEDIQEEADASEAPAKDLIADIQEESAPEEIVESSSDGSPVPQEPEVSIAKEKVRTHRRSDSDWIRHVTNS
jgi:hypothetical protein